IAIPAVAITRVVALVAILVAVAQTRIDQPGYSEAVGSALNPGKASDAGIGHGAIAVAEIAITLVVGIVAARPVGAADLRLGGTRTLVDADPVRALAVRAMAVAAEHGVNQRADNPTLVIA